MPDKRTTINHQFDQQVIERINLFATDTIKKIFQHISRLKIGESTGTGALADSIRAVVHTNAGGKQALVQFFYLYYGECVEQAVGKYYTVDSDLGKKVGVKSLNIKAPQIERVGYGPMTATFKGLPSQENNEMRRRTHRPRPFLWSEIKRQVDRTTLLLMRETGKLVETRLWSDVVDALGDESLLHTAMLLPYKGQKALNLEGQILDGGEVEILSAEI